MKRVTLIYEVSCFKKQTKDNDILNFKEKYELWITKITNLLP